MILDSEEAARAWFEEQFSPNPTQWEQLDKFAELLREENDRQNLIAASTVPNLWVRHFADSAQLLTFTDRTHGAWIDLGSGPGLPGIILAILTGDPITLVESRRLRCNFLRDVGTHLCLPHIAVVESRLEIVESFPAAYISARAFAPLEKLLNLANRFAGPGTHWLLPKGQKAVIELETLPKSWQHMFHVEHSLTDADSRILVGQGQLPAKKRGKI